MKSDGERLDNGIVELHTLNVGQADATAVITGEGSIILNDADKEAVEEQLETVLADRAVKRTDNGTVPFISATTHFHQDHVNGLSALSHNEYEISHAIFPTIDRINVYDSDVDESENGLSEENLLGFINDLEALGAEELTEASEGDEISVDGDTDINVLAPPATDDSEKVTRAATGSEVQLPPERPNENGAVYKIEGERSVLFMGDVQDKSDHYGESWLIQQHDNPESDVDFDTDVAFIAHHGSDNATSTEYLARADPEIAVISSDFAEQHNHPHDAVLKNLHEHDVDVYWTAGHGTTRIDLDDTLTTGHTEALDTTAPADLAALKHYCRENDINPQAVDQIDADTLPEDTPDWAAETSTLVVDQAANEKATDPAPETTTATEETTRSERSDGAAIAETINTLDADDITEDATTEMENTERTDDTSEKASLGADIANAIDNLGPEDFPDTVDIEDVMQSHADAMRDKDDQTKDPDAPGTQGV
jgi:competence protein ComEC